MPPSSTIFIRSIHSMTQEALYETVRCPFCKKTVLVNLIVNMVLRPSFPLPTALHLCTVLSLCHILLKSYLPFLLTRISCFHGPWLLSQPSFVKLLTLFRHHYAVEESLTYTNTWHAPGTWPMLKKFFLSG